MLPETKSVDELKAQVKNYVDHMTKKYQADPNEIFLAATMSVDSLKKIIDSYPGCSGVRIYLTKETPDGAGDIWPLIVPVRKENDEWFTDLLTDDHSLLESGNMSNFDCRNPPCALRNKGSILLPEELKK